MPGVVNLLPAAVLARPKDPFSLTVMLCALFVVKQPLLDQFMASDLGEEMDTETEISGDIRILLPREGSVNAYGFHLGEMKANRTKMWRDT